MNLTETQIAELAPDAASLKAGRHLSSQTWAQLGASERALWGAIFGSGKKPYQVAVDLRTIAYKCTCPSRKFPCKHTLALMLHAANNNLAHTDEPEWVVNWLDSRDNRAAKKAEKELTEASKAQDNAESHVKTNAPYADQAPSKRTVKKTTQDRRAERVKEGFETLKTRLSDLARVGLSSLSPENSLWEEASKRLIDSQAPGVASMVAELAQIERDERWKERLLGKLGKLALLTEAYERIDALPEDLACELRQTIGWTIPQASVLSEGERISDRWLSLGFSYDAEGRVTAKRAWFLGLESRRFALHLQFGAGRNPSFSEHVPVGTLRFQTHARFFPGVVKERALWEDARNPNALMSRAPLPYDAAIDFTELRERYADALSVYPWRKLMPAILRGTAIRPVDDKRYVVLNGAGQELPCVAVDTIENFVASSASRPVELFGEWSGESFRPIASWQDGFHDGI